MRITFVLPHAGLAGGIRVVAIYATRLKRRGHTVHIVSVPRNKLRTTDTFKRFLRKCPRIGDLCGEHSHLDGVSVNHRIIESKRPLLETDMPDSDVVVATFWESALWVNNLSSRKGIKVYLVQGHNSLPDQPNRQIERSWLLPLHKIVVSQWLARLAAEKYGDRHVTIVPNGVDKKQFWAHRRRKSPYPTVGVVYSPSYAKGCDIALKAFRKAKDILPELRLISFGARKLRKAMPLPQGSLYYKKPPQKKLRHIYSACDAWLFCSRQEGFGLPILEAMACRTPVIATPAGAAPELLSVGGGKLLNTINPKEMADAIVEMCSLHEDKWQKLSEEAHNTSVTYSWDNATDLFEAALSSLHDTERNKISPL